MGVLRLELGEPAGDPEGAGRRRREPELMPSSAVGLLDVLAGLGMTHLVGLPDNDTAPLFALAGDRSHVDLLTVAREGEAFAVASGLWLGGKTPVVVVQNTGLLESGDSLRGTAYRMGVPLLVLTSVRGQAKMDEHAEQIAAARQRGGWPGVLQRPDIDSVALLTEATLAAWGVPYRDYAGDGDGDGVGELWARGRESRHPVALLLRERLTAPEKSGGDAC